VEHAETYGVTPYGKEEPIMTLASLDREPRRRRTAPAPSGPWVLRLGPGHYWFLLAAIAGIASIVLLLLLIDPLRLTR
jgi:hypothetical protein